MHTAALELTTRREVVGALGSSSSGRVIALFAGAAWVLRAQLGGPGWADAVVVAAVLLLLGPVEWVIHRWLLHASPGNMIGEVLGTRDSHERHHRDPDDLEWLLLRRPNAIGSCLAIVVPFALFALVAVAAGGAQPVPAWTAASTAMGTGLLALLHYEWVHLLVHSRYRPRSRYYARLDRNHRLHHFRNERYWLGVTVDVGDRLARTLPASRDAVPQSATVRAQ